MDYTRPPDVNLSAYLAPKSLTEVGVKLIVCENPGKQVYRKIDPIRAPIHSLIVIWCTEKPVKSSFSVSVENKPYYRPVCQNKADLHLTQCPLMALQSRLFLPCNISSMNPLNPSRTPMRGSFFWEDYYKNGNFVSDLRIHKSPMTLIVFKKTDTMKTIIPQ